MNFSDLSYIKPTLNALSFSHQVRLFG